MMTRLQFFVVVALIVMMGFGLGGLLELNKLVEKPSFGTVMSASVSGIETSWHSRFGGERVWTISASDDYKVWMQDHVAVITEAQRLLPMEK